MLGGETANSVGEWLDLYIRYRGDARTLLKNKRPSGAWFNTGFSIECLLKAAIMQKTGWNRWPTRDQRPDLYTHDPRALTKELGITLSGLRKHAVGPSLKIVLQWERAHGYGTASVPEKFAEQMWDAAFGAEGVAEWIASTFRLNI